MNQETNRCTEKETEIQKLKTQLEGLGGKNSNPVVSKKNQEILDLREEIIQIQSEAVEALGRQTRAEQALMAREAEAQRKRATGVDWNRVDVDEEFGQYSFLS